MAPAQALGLYIVRDCLFDRTRFPGLCDGERTGVARQKRSGDGAEHQTRQKGDGQDVLVDLFPADVLRGAKDDALDSVVDATAGLEGVGGGRLGEVAEVGLQ